jgi:hypothetical protein
MATELLFWRLHHCSCNSEVKNCCCCHHNFLPWRGMDCGMWYPVTMSTSVWPCLPSCTEMGRWLPLHIHVDHCASAFGGLGFRFGNLALSTCEKHKNQISSSFAEKAAKGRASVYHSLCNSWHSEFSHFMYVFLSVWKPFKGRGYVLTIFVLVGEKNLSLSPKCESTVNNGK